MNFSEVSTWAFELPMLRDNVADTNTGERSFE